MDIGTNLAGVNYWATQDPFIDRFKTAGAWGATNSQGKDISSSVKLDADGYPTDLSAISKLSVLFGVDPRSAAPIDQYVVTYSGSASIKITGVDIVSSAPGKIVFNYTSDDPTPSVFMSISNLSNSKPIHDIHVVRADQVDLFAAGETFNPELISKVSQWSTIRLMDWGNTNDSASVSWAARTQTSSVTWAKSTNADGVPLEVMVKLANEAHVDMWYNIPTKANDAYVTQALTYIRDHLDPTLKVEVEYSNEVWNKSFAANSYAQDKANSLWGVDSNNNGKISGNEVVANGANLYYGYRSAQIASIGHNVFGASADSRLVDVIGGQSANSGVLANVLQGVAKAGKGAASDLFDVYAIAPYFGSHLGNAGSNAADRATILSWARSGSAGLTAAFHELEFGGALSQNYSLATVDTWLGKAQLAAENAGLDLVAYEGGASLYSSAFPSANQAEVEAFFAKLINDPRMGDLYTKLLADFEAHGGKEFVAFNDASVSGKSGYWGSLDSIYDDTSARYEALLAARDGPVTAPVPVPVPTPTPTPVPPTPNAPTQNGDSLQASASGGALNGLGGNDTIKANGGNDTIDGGAGNDSITGSSSTTDGKGNLIEHDYYLGGAGSDTIVGGAGNDHIYGYGTSVAPKGADGADSLSGGGGNDVVNGDAGADTIDGGNGNDNLSGGADNDSMIGGAGNDKLHGNSGDDRVSGGDGNDVIYGDGGYDVLIGGAGADTFAFAAHHAEFVSTGSLAYKSDEITDFTNGTDRIALGFDVSQILHGSAATVAAAATWAAQALLGHAGSSDVATVSVGSDTYLFYDDAGKGGTMDALIKLDDVSGTAIGISDFV